MTNSVVSFHETPPAPSLATENRWTLGSLLENLWRRRFRFVWQFLALYAVLTAVMLAVPSQYVASTLLAYDPRPMRSVLNTLSSRPDNNAGQQDSRSDTVAILATEADVVSSHATVAHFLDTLPRDQWPRETGHLGAARGWIKNTWSELAQRYGWEQPLDAKTKAVRDAAYRYETLIANIRSNLTADVPQTASLLRVSYRDFDPVRAALFVNGVVAAYLRDQVAGRRAIIAATVKQLQARLAELGTEVEKTDRAVQDFRRGNDLIKESGQPSPNLQRLSDISINEARVRAELAEARAHLTSLEVLPLDSIAVLQPSASGPGGQLTTQIVTQQADLSRRLTVAAALRDPGDRQYQILMSEQANLHRMLVQQGRIILLKIQGDVLALAAKMGELEASRRVTTNEIIKENDLDSQLIRLTIEAQSKRSGYDAFLTGMTRIAVMESSQAPELRVVDTAIPPMGPHIPPTIMMAILVPVSCLCSAVLVLWTHSREQHKYDRRFEETYNVPVLGITPAITTETVSRAADRCHALMSDPIYADRLRGIRNVIDLYLPSDSQTIAIISTAPAEGKSVLARSLAIAWASANVPTLVIDCDPRRSGMLPPPGLTRDKAAAIEQMIKTSPLGYDIIEGSPSSSTLYSFSEARLRELIKTLYPRYQRIILDLPPMTLGADGTIGSVVADFVVFTSRWRKADITTATALQRLRSFKAKIGAVLTQASIKELS